MIRIVSLVTKIQGKYFTSNLFVVYIQARVYSWSNFSSLFHWHPHWLQTCFQFRMWVNPPASDLFSRFCFLCLISCSVCGVILQHPRQQTPTMCSSFSLRSHSDATHCRLSRQLHHRLVSHLYVAMGTALLVTPPSFPINPPPPNRSGERLL